MRCPHCDKTISQNDKFCRHCGQPVVAPPPPAQTRPSSGHAIIPIEYNDFGPAEILAPHSSLTWGAHIYTGHSTTTLLWYWPIQLAQLAFSV